MVAGRDDDLERQRVRFQLDVGDGELVRAGLPSRGEDLRVHPPTSGVGVLDRCAAILRAVEDGARSFTDIVAATGLSRSTAHRLIQGLEDHGFLAADRRLRLRARPPPAGARHQRGAGPAAPRARAPGARTPRALDRRERAALRPRRRSPGLHRRRRVRERAPHDRRDRRVAPAHEGLGRDGLPRVGRRPRPGEARPHRRGSGAARAEAHHHQAPRMGGQRGGARARRRLRQRARLRSRRRAARGRLRLRDRPHASGSSARSATRPRSSRRPREIEALGASATRRRPRARRRPGPGRSRRACGGRPRPAGPRARGTSSPAAPRSSVR